MSEASKRTQFQVGNRFWEYSNPCKPMSYQPEALWHKAVEYLNWCQDNPIYAIEYYGKDAVECEVPKMRAPSIRGFCVFANITSATWYNYAKIPTYLDICSHISDALFEIKFSGAAAGVLNPNIIARDLGLVDKKEVTNNDAVTVTFMTPDNGRLIAQPAALPEINSQLIESQEIPYIESPKLKLDIPDASEL